jgi:hypothetical protein
MGETYYARVRAFDGMDWGGWSECDWTLPANTPPTTNPVSVPNPESPTPTIVWTYGDAEGDPQVQYEVEVWTEAGGSGTCVWDPSVGSGTDTSVVYAGAALVMGETYYARVRAFDGMDWGGWSECDWTLPGVLSVGIDIKPGSEINPVNLKSRGVLPVAVFSTDTFDATDIDPSTAVLAGAPVAQNPDDGGWMIHEEDVNGDGLMDALLHFETEEIDVELLVDDEYAVLTGTTFGGTDFVGQDHVRIVPPDLPNDSWALESIAACLEAGVVQGYPDGEYRPDRDVSRDQMAVFISRAMVAGDGAVPDGPAEPTFPDVPSDHWAYNYIEYAAANGVVAGYPNGYYRPRYNVSRAEMAVFVARAQGWVSLGDDMSTAPELFSDVPAGFWAGTAIEACVTHEVVHGYPDGRYRPKWHVTRDQMAVYVARAFDLGT